MKASDDLFRLIRSMTPSEKRYFSAQNSNKSDKPNYMVLYEVLNKLEEYEEEQVKRHLGNSTIAKYLSREKAYLMDSLLHSLRDYHSGRYARAEVSKLLFEAQLLHDRNLYQLCGKKLAKAKELASKHEMFLALAEINALERTLAKRSPVEMEQLIERLLSEKDHYLEKLVQFFHFRDLNDVLFCKSRGQFRIRDEKQKEAIRRAFSQTETNEFPEYGSFEAKRLFLFAWGQYHTLLGEDQKAKDRYKALARLWEDHPEHLSESPKSYKVALANYLNLCHLTRAYQEFPDALKKIEGIKPETKEEEGEDFQNLAHLELLYFINTGQFIAAQALIQKKIKDGLVLFRKKITPARRLTICHSVAMLYLVLGKYQDARYWLGTLQDSEKQDHRRDLLRFSRLLDVILAYEEGKLEQWPVDKWKSFVISRKKSALRWLKLDGELMEYEGVVLSMVPKLIGKNADKQKELCQRLKSELEAVPPQEQVQFGGRISELSLWIAGQLTGERLESILLKRVREAGF